MSTGPAVIAHRGASEAFPENTVAAFRGARAMGADWVELDVRRSGDGALVVHHDEVLPNGQPVATATRGALPAGVPLLVEALAACDGMGVNVEVKPQPLAVVEPTVAACREWGGPVLLSSFDPAVLRRIREVAPELPTAVLVVALGDLDALLRHCVDEGHTALHPWDPTVDEAVVGRCRAAGLDVNTWTTDDPDRIRQLAAWGVTGICTNVPDVALRALGRSA